jgi:heat shock protein HspQ
MAYVERMNAHLARFAIGQIVRHRLFPFRGVVFDVDPQYANTEQWYRSIPEPVRPRRDQPFYHLLAENDNGAYMAYVSEQNLQADETGEPVEHPQIPLMFEGFKDGHYLLKPHSAH